MRRLHISILFCLSAVMLLGQGSISAYDDGDWQYWNREGVEGSITDDLKAKMEVEFRFGDNMGELYYQHSELALSHRCTGWLTFTVNYRQIYEKKGEVWKQENRPHLNAILRWSWSGFGLEDRSRLEYRVREGKDDALRCRNRLALKLPLNWGNFNVQPYIADEIFLDFEKGELNRNRLYLGANGNLGKGLKAETYYLWQTSKSEDRWGDYNIIGTKLKAAF
ncbi:MAG: DUF2490 domain-containing protein [Candidatus Zixiibacteriota bacterium]